MSKVHFFPDLSYHEAKNLEEKYNADDEELPVSYTHLTLPTRTRV